MVLDRFHLFLTDDRLLGSWSFACFLSFLNFLLLLCLLSWLDSHHGQNQPLHKEVELLEINLLVTIIVQSLEQSLDLTLTVVKHLKAFILHLLLDFLGQRFTFLLIEKPVLVDVELVKHLLDLVSELGTVNMSLHLLDVVVRWSELVVIDDLFLWLFDCLSSNWFLNILLRARLIFSLGINFLSGGRLLRGLILRQRFNVLLPFVIGDITSERSVLIPLISLSFDCFLLSNLFLCNLGGCGFHACCLARSACCLSLSSRNGFLDLGLPFRRSGSTLSPDDVLGGRSGWCCSAIFRDCLGLARILLRSSLGACCELLGVLSHLLLCIWSFRCRLGLWLRHLILALEVLQLLLTLEHLIGITDREE